MFSLLLLLLLGPQAEAREKDEDCVDCGRRPAFMTVSAQDLEFFQRLSEEQAKEPFKSVGATEDFKTWACGQQEIGYRTLCQDYMRNHPEKFRLLTLDNKWDLAGSAIPSIGQTWDDRGSETRIMLHLRFNFGGISK